jgi:hypothetical protein
MRNPGSVRLHGRPRVARRLKRRSTRATIPHWLFRITDRQVWLSLEKFAFMHAVIFGTLGICALQKRNASPMQAERCSGVPCAKPGVAWANSAVASAAPISP